jgi:hypothetical protein
MMDHRRVHVGRHLPCCTNPDREGLSRSRYCDQCASAVVNPGERSRKLRNSECEAGRAEMPKVDESMSSQSTPRTCARKIGTEAGGGWLVVGVSLKRQSFFLCAKTVRYGVGRCEDCEGCEGCEMRASVRKSASRRRTRASAGYVYRTSGPIQRPEAKV